MSSLRQSVSHDVYAESKTFYFSEDVPAGDLLLAYVSTADAVYGDEYLWTLLGYEDPGFATVSISTPGLSWVLLGSCDATVDPYMAVMGMESAKCRIAVYAAFNVPALAASVGTIITSSNSPTDGSSGATVSLLDFSTTAVVSAVASTVRVIQNGSDIGPPSLGDFSWTTTEPTYPITAGIISTNPGDLVVMAAPTTSFRTYIITPGDYSGAGFTEGASNFDQYMVSPGGGINTQLALPPVTGFSALAFTFGAHGGGGGGGGGAGGTVPICTNACSGPPLLNVIPGFSDLPDSVLATDDPTFALHVGEISFNAAFGMVRTEIFPYILKHGDTVPLPVSCADGYTYAREELLYIWTVRNSTDPSTNWMGGPDCLWFTNWNVDQTTGAVFSEEWYERSSTADSRMESKTNDGSILVFTIGQRQKTNMIMRAAASYTGIDESTIATDKPMTQALIQALNDDAKFSVVGTEIFYLGEYVDGQTVTLPISPVDDYAYSNAECKFMHAWRWTASGAAYVQPPWGSPGPFCDQLGPFKASVSNVGVCSISVSFVYNGGELTNTPAGFGRIAVFAMGRRSATPGSMALANKFTELDVGLFVPGEDLRASTLLAIKRNIDEAILSPEFFGPTDHADGDTIALPVSPVDGYTYTRDEITCVWSWSDTKNNSSGGWPGSGHSRLPLFLGAIDQATGAVALQVWRAPPGTAPFDDTNTNARITVIVMGNRKASHPALIDGTGLGTPAGTYAPDVSGSAILVNGT